MRRLEREGLLGFGFEMVPEGVETFVSTRAGGVSAPPYESLNLGFHVGDDSASVLENRRRVATAIGAELASLVVAEQVHEGTVAAVGEAERGRGAFDLESSIPATDALITDRPGVVLAVLVADCVPVVLADPEAPAIGVAHAGWAGTVRHIARDTVAAMGARFGSDPARMTAAIGPSIGPRSYEVGPEVAARARAEFPDARAISTAGERLCLDLWESNRADLLAAGLDARRIEVAGIDSFAAADLFFSHRRGHPTGRFIALARIAGG